MLYPLGVLTADDRGAADGTFTVPGISAVPAGEWFVSVHAGPRLDTPEQYRAIVCADVVHGGDNVSVSMDPVPGAGNNPTGTAALTYDAAAGKLTVAVTVSGLDPNTRHANQLRDGSCAAAGDVKFELDDLVANAAGSAAATSVVVSAAPIAYGSWYVVVDRGAPSEQQSQPGSTPIACADVVRAG